MSKFGEVNASRFIRCTRLILARALGHQACHSSLGRHLFRFHHCWTTTNGRNIRRLVNPASHQFRMTAVELHNTTEVLLAMCQIESLLTSNCRRNRNCMTLSTFSMQSPPIQSITGYLASSCSIYVCENDSKAYTQSSRLLSILCWWNRTNSAKIKNIRCRRTVTRSKTRPMISTMCSTGWKPTTSR